MLRARTTADTPVRQERSMPNGKILDTRAGGSELPRPPNSRGLHSSCRAAW